MPSVFHYTNSAGLLGILQTKCLFATEYRYLNDLSEGSMIRDHICKIFEAEIEEMTPKLVEAGYLNEHLYKHHGEGIHRQQAEGTYRAIIKAMDNTTPIFVLSFCRHKDDKDGNVGRHGLLSQWRAYAGYGFAMEFDESGLNEMLTPEHETFAYPLMKSGDVRYRGYEEMLDPDVYRGVAGELIRTGFKSRDVSEITGRKELDDVALKLAATAFFLKHHGFEEEQEYRIIAAPVRKDKIRKDAIRTEKEILFRSREGLIVPYIELFKELVSRCQSSPSLLVHIRFRRNRQMQF